MKTLKDLSSSMPQIAAYGIPDIERAESICMMLESAHEVVLAAQLILSDITAQGNTGAQISPRAGIRLTNSLLRLAANDEPRDQKIHGQDCVEQT